MSQAEELLNSLSYESGDNGDHIIISSDRTLYVPESIKKIAVQHDHNIRTVTFDCPRYSDGRDMSLMSIYVNYMRADEYMDSDACENIVVDENDSNIIHFDWVIEKNVTEVHGELSVLVCIKKCDADGNEENHWNSEINNDLYVSEGMECQPSVIAKYPDIVEHLLLRMSTVEDKTTQAAMLNYVKTYLDRDPSVIIEKIDKVITDEKVQSYVEGYLDEYVDICTTTDRALSNSVAGAYELVGIKGNSEQVKTEGYQLFKHSATELATFTKGGVTIKNWDNGNFTVEGTGTLTESVSKYHYYTHAESVKLFKAGMLYMKHTGDLTSPSIYFHPQVNNTSLATMTPGNVTEFELTQEMLDDETFRMVVGIYANSGAKIVSGDFSIMLYQDGLGDLEKFTGGVAAPNPDYPQEINSVSNELTIRTINKNFLSTNDIELGMYTNSEFNVQSSTVYASAKTYLPAGTYTISFDKSVYIVRGIMDTMLTHPTNALGVDSYTFTTKTDGMVGFTWRDVTSAETDWDIASPVQIEAGEKATNYIQHEKSAISISVTEPLRAKNNVNDIITKRDDKWGVLRKWKKAILDAASFAEITWTEYENVTFFTLPKPEDALVYEEYLTVDAMCDKFRCDTIHPIDQPSMVGNINTAASAPLLWFGFPKGTTLSEAQTVGEIEYIYQLAEPVWEELDEESQIAIDNLQIFDDITHVVVESSVQPTVTSKYGTSEVGARTLTNSNNISKIYRLLSKNNI